IAWLVYWAVNKGWLASLLQKISAVAVVGRNGLVCFVGGAVISIWAEALSFTLAGGTPVWPLNLVADVFAVGALFALAYGWEAFRRARKPAMEARPRPVSPSF